MVEVEGLFKRFGRRIALKNVSFRLQEGTITALIGPNGSGKTTILKILCSLVRPDRGSIRLGGKDPRRDPEVRRLIGYMPQVYDFPEHRSPSELIRWLKEIRAQPASREEDLVRLFELAPEMKRSLGTLSWGTRAKVACTLALMFSSPILLLDEPTAGMDPIASTRLKDLLRMEREEGKTILLSSHSMADVAEVGDRLLLLERGNLVLEGNPKKIMETEKVPTLERAIAQILENRRHGQAS
ncbi:ABC transporter ATP-binding protein [Candidatus Methylacidiphilum fumarolicum]|uniref:ABC transporter n=2 Tax=Candidatus Methylacidiphilum fumarolicum TaxID=591154 RepID=A0ABM9IG93_9BACT|nr:ABC transporter ATP-binding protein [Candidatus Methylacidiphilum fumarolicum]MBW6414059.1 ABC transporter ATP-binding protein [Candidatus Methylacidiphilum fumarolicum]TFE66407.1 hypothetical protein A7K73_01480 [Candidatus Methylacidiphilum fumarolicum]TFE75254.1 ABC transporter ATP-binding protein [Candidatus Methylacidiphilum fumarolicum]TFE76134.1 ABC transporter ATP-binding protein [Candidatus Methylacidiphilum fumarolicum]TFE77280.1 hypothetical protein A7D33_05595 [Candidatus Methyl